MRENNLVKVDRGYGDLIEPVGNVEVNKLSDTELLKKCDEYGSAARTWTKKFAGLLPEVFKRKLYRRKGFLSIHHFANVIGGLSEYAVDKILNLAEKLKDKPILLRQLETGAQGWSKIEKVAYIATAETDRQWAEKVEKLPTRSLEGYVQNFRRNFTHVSEREVNQQIWQQATPESEILQRFSIPISHQLQFDLRLCKQKLEKLQKQSLTWNEVLETLITGDFCPKCAANRMASGENSLSANNKSAIANSKSASANNKSAIANNMSAIANNMSVIANNKSVITSNKSAIINNKFSIAGNKPEIALCPDCVRRKEILSAREKAMRYISADVKKLIWAKYGNKCAFPNCNYPWELLHHIKRYALVKNHDPNFVVPLCKVHHDFAHGGLIENEGDLPEKWKIRQTTEKGTIISSIDEKVQFFKMSKGNL